MNSEEVFYDLALYHGTSEEYSQNIIQNGFQKQPVKRNNDWLGHGIYFFREDQEQAMLWAQLTFRKDKTVKSVCVLKIMVRINDSNFLNLDSMKGMNFFVHYVRSVKEQILNKVKFKGTPDQLRHLIMGKIPQTYKVIQYTFKNRKYAGNDILRIFDMESHGVQVCIRDEKLIPREINVILKEEAWPKQNG